MTRSSLEDIVSLLDLLEHALTVPVQDPSKPGKFANSADPWGGTQSGAFPLRGMMVTIREIRRRVADGLRSLPDEPAEDLGLKVLSREIPLRAQASRGPLSVNAGSAVNTGSAGNIGPASKKSSVGGEGASSPGDSGSQGGLGVAAVVSSPLASPTGTLSGLAQAGSSSQVGSGRSGLSGGTRGLAARIQMSPLQKRSASEQLSRGGSHSNTGNQSSAGNMREIGRAGTLSSGESRS